MKRSSSTVVALVTGLLLPGAIRAEKPLTPEALVPCPFTEAEVEAALEVKVEKGEAADMSTPDGRDVGCIYPVKGSEMVLVVRQTWEGGKSSSAQSTVPAQGEVQAIAGDPDGAWWLIEKKDKPRVELTYSKGKVKTKVIVHGDEFRTEDFQPRILKLKRVP